MKDRRTAPRRRVLKSGSIVLSKAPKLDCTVKNISETDAMLQVFTTLGIPASFDIFMEGARRHCHSVWRQVFLRRTRGRCRFECNAYPGLGSQHASKRGVTIKARWIVVALLS